MYGETESIGKHPQFKMYHSHSRVQLLSLPTTSIFAQHCYAAVNDVMKIPFPPNHWTSCVLSPPPPNFQKRWWWWWINGWTDTFWQLSWSGRERKKEQTVLDLGAACIYLFTEHMPGSLHGQGSCCELPFKVWVVQIVAEGVQLATTRQKAQNCSYSTADLHKPSPLRVHTCIRKM